MPESPQPAAASEEQNPKTPTRSVQPLCGTSAVHGSGTDAPVPAHYGAPTREQRRLLGGRAVVDLEHLELLDVHGPDALTWLTTITSQVFTGRAVGESARMAVLSPQGRVEHMADVVITAEDGALLICDAGCRAGLRRYLEMMRFASRVEIIDRDDLRVLGATVPEALERAGGPALEAVAVHIDHWPDVAPGGVAYGPDPEDPVGAVLIVVREADARAATWSPDHLAGMLAWEATRIADHRARQSTEVDDRAIPHELDLLRQWVHTAKGCYRGQETVAKVMNLGQPPRRLVMLHLDGSQDAPIAAGGEVRLGGADGKVVGRVTSAGIHVDFGPIALAVIKRAVPVDAALSAQMLIHGTSGSEDSVWLDAAQEPVVLEREHGKRPPTARL